MIDSARVTKFIALVFIFVQTLLTYPVVAQALTLQQPESTGVEGIVAGPPPSQAATIDVPKNGQNFSNLPIIVSGLCPSGTLVEIFTNDVFSGSTTCSRGSYSLQMDLFEGRNDLVARVYDSLNQAGPDSSIVTVNFSSNVAGTGPRISLTTQFAVRGAQPGAILSWPITLSGGTPPYAVSVDWGDKTDSDLVSEQAPGNISLQHTFAQSGVYKVTIKTSDTAGNTAFLQVVAIGNGPIQQSSSKGSGIITSEKTKILWLPIGLLFALAVFNYWLGQKRQLETIRNRLRKGEPPFA